MGEAQSKSLIYYITMFSKSQELFWNFKNFFVVFAVGALRWRAVAGADALNAANARLARD